MKKVAFKFNVTPGIRHRDVIAGNCHLGYRPGIAGMKQRAAGKSIVLVAKGFPAGTSMHLEIPPGNIGIVLLQPQIILPVVSVEHLQTVIKLQPVGPLGAV